MLVQNGGELKKERSGNISDLCGKHHSSLGPLDSVFTAFYHAVCPYLEMVPSPVNVHSCVSGYLLHQAL